MDSATKLVVAICGTGTLILVGWIWLDSRPPAPPAPAAASAPMPVVPMTAAAAAPEPMPPVHEEPTPAPQPEPVPVPVVADPVPVVVQKTPEEQFYEELRAEWRLVASPLVPDSVGESHLLLNDVPKPGGDGCYFTVSNLGANAFPVGFARKVNGKEVASLEEAEEVFKTVKVGDELSIDFDEAVAWKTASPKWQPATTTIKADSTRMSQYEQRVQRKEDKIARYERVLIPIDRFNYNDPLSLYIHKSKDGSPALMLEMSHWGDDWVFAEVVVLAIGEERISLSVDPTRDVVSGGVHERAVKEISTDLKLQRLLASSDGEFLIRFQGASKRKDYTIDSRMRNDLKVMVCMFYADRFGK